MRLEGLEREFHPRDRQDGAGPGRGISNVPPDSHGGAGGDDTSERVRWWLRLSARASPDQYWLLLHTTRDTLLRAIKPTTACRSPATRRFPLSLHPHQRYGHEGDEALHARRGRAGTSSLFSASSVDNAELTLHSRASTTPRRVWYVSQRRSFPCISDPKCARHSVDRNRRTRIRRHSLPQPPSRRRVRFPGRGRA